MSDITKAIAILKRGGLVAIPTETVYGLSADACNEAAVKRIFKAKERPFDHPLIVHIGVVQQLSDWAREIPEEAWQLAERFWPGPLTFILKKQEHVLDSVTGGQDTVGVRMPRHPIALKLLQGFGGGLAAPSANKFTHISPTTAEAVKEELGNSVDLILDGGDCVVGLESTILDLTKSDPVILRPGMITAEMLSEILGKPVKSSLANHDVRTAGMHHLHYAPVTKTSLINTENIPEFLSSMTEDDLPMALITHTPFQISKKNIVHKPLPRDAAKYAHDMYRLLRELDHQNVNEILIENVPEGVEWDAVRDRLNKASGGEG